MAQASKISSSTLEIPTARVFRPLLKPSRYKGLYGGRGSAKSHFFAELTMERCIQRQGTRIVCVREIQRTLKESVKRLVEDKIKAFNVGHKFRPMVDSIITPGDGMIIFQGMQDHTAESIKSLEGFDIAYIEQAEMLTKASLEMLRPTIRKPGSEIWASWNPRHASDPIDELLRGASVPPDAIIVRTSWRDNPWFPEELEAERRYDEEHKPDRYAHIWEGEYEPQAIGALWSRLTIHRNRRAQAPVMRRIVIAVDPPIASPTMDKTDVAEAGIVACGLGEDGRGYVLDDASMQGAPQAWGERVVALHDLHEADAVIAEVNQGGEMVKHVIHSVRPSVRVIMVRATRGKHIRAEPIASLYDLDRISHVGAYPELEAQLCLFTAEGYQGDLSPDRADAAIWGLTELFPKLIRRSQPRDKQPPARANSLYNPHRMRAKR